MKDWIIKKLVEWLASNLTEEIVKEWADKAKQVIAPKLREWADLIVEKCREEAAKTDTTIDDVACDALEVFLDALLPDTETTV
jgi:DNA-binding ferritin-like protein (Dps family)